MAQEFGRMLTFQRSGLSFTLRAAAVVIRNGHVLMHRIPPIEWWVLPGGRCEFGEPAQAAIIREMQEEMGADVRVDRLLWVVENMFEYEERFCHELGLYFLVYLPDSFAPAREIEFFGREGEQTIVFRWIPIDELDQHVVYPTFLTSALHELPTGTEYILHIDNEVVLPG